MSRQHILTSGDVMIHYLKTHFGPAPYVYLAGTPELETQFRDAGIYLCSTQEALPPQAVVLGFDTTFDFAKAETLCRYISAGAPFLATNIDRVCPLEGGAYLPDCGSMARMIAPCNRRGTQIHRQALPGNGGLHLKRRRDAT